MIQIHSRPTPQAIISTCVSIATLAFIFATVCGDHARAQWEVQSAPTVADLRGIDNIGKGIVWVSGTDGTILRTTSDGKDWKRCATPPAAEHLDFRGIKAFDASTAIVMSSGKGPLSRLYKTTDACQTWALVFTNPDAEGFFDAIQFSDRSNGYILGDPVNGAMAVWHGRSGKAKSIGVAFRSACAASMSISSMPRRPSGVGQSTSARRWLMGLRVSRNQIPLCVSTCFR